jgi:hypothetical protein
MSTTKATNTGNILNKAKTSIGINNPAVSCLVDDLQVAKLRVEV